MTGTLADRPAGYEVIREILDRQSRRPPRGALARFFGLSPIPADDASWYTGALGEQAVGRQLARLGPEWTVLHAIPVGAGDSDIDHLLIGPPGVFSLNTKRHKGKKIWVADRRILVAGQKVDHLRNARAEMSRSCRARGAQSRRRSCSTLCSPISQSSCGSRTALCDCDFSGCAASVRFCYSWGSRL